LSLGNSTGSSSSRSAAVLASEGSVVVDPAIRDLAAFSARQRRNGKPDGPRRPHRSRVASVPHGLDAAVLDDPPSPAAVEGAEGGLRTRGPRGLPLVGAPRVPEPEVLHQALLGEIRGARVHLAGLPALAGAEPHPGADRVTVRARAHEHELDPVRGAALVA